MFSKTKSVQKLKVKNIEQQKIFYNINWGTADFTTQLSRVTSDKLDVLE